MLNYIIIYIIFPKVGITITLMQVFNLFGR